MLYIMLCLESIGSDYVQVNCIIKEQFNCNLQRNHRNIMDIFL